jgi:tetratricopeptide (TPR) repeat protein
MRITVLVLAGFTILAIAGCSTTTVVTKHGQDKEIEQGPSRIVDEKDVKEEKGVTSKPVEPEKPTGTEKTSTHKAGIAKEEKSYNPSAVEPDLKAAKARELETPEFSPAKTGRLVDSQKAAALLREMKSEQTSKEERTRKMDELVAKVRNASDSEENKAQAQKLCVQAEKLHSEKKFNEAVAAYKKVIAIMPRHKKALAGLKQCYRDMEEEGKQAEVVKKPATAQDMLLIEQKFAAAVSLYDEGSKDDALKKFKEIVEMIQWSTTKIDTKNYLGKTRDYVEKIKIEKELEKEPAKEEEKKQPKKKAPAKEEKKETPKKPEQPKKPKIPGPGDIAPG